jgi:hypothetical protein
VATARAAEVNGRWMAASWLALPSDSVSEEALMVIGLRIRRVWVPCEFVISIEVGG